MYNHISNIVSFASLLLFPKMANSENAIIEDYLNCRQQVLSELSSQVLWNACNTDSEDNPLFFADKYRDPTTKEVIFCLTSEGKDILNKSYKVKICLLIRKILEHEVFYKTFESTMINGEIPKTTEVCKIMSTCDLGISQTTMERRSSTVRGWIDWILKLTSDV